MKCQSLFSGKNKKNMINLSSVELAFGILSVKILQNLNVWGLPLELSFPICVKNFPKVVKKKSPFKIVRKIAAELNHVHSVISSDLTLSVTYHHYSSFAQRDAEALCKIVGDFSFLSTSDQLNKWSSLNTVHTQFSDFQKSILCD